MAKLLIIYSTTDGHTLKIAQRLATIIEQHNQPVTLCAITDVAGLDLISFDKIIIGASIRYGKHHPLVFDFIRKYQALLESKPNAFFSVNVVARKPNKNQPDTNPYCKKFLKKIAWKPQHVAVFAGKLEYPSYSVFDRLVIRLIMWMTHGPTDPETVVEFTDWQQVDAFGRVLAAM
jgi:menaquinone-dependent protoporphyrinogen oxidase